MESYDDYLGAESLCGPRHVYQEAGDKHGWVPSTVKTMLRR